MFHNIYYAPKRSAIGQAPTRSPHPAISLRHIVPPIEPPHLTHPACLERGIERGLGCIIAHAFARKDRDGRDALGRILVAVPGDAEHRAALHVGIRKGPGPTKSTRLTAAKAASKRA